MSFPTDEELKQQLNNSLTNHTPDEDTIRLIEGIRGQAKVFGQRVIDACPSSRERSLALTHLEDSVMWAVKSLVLPRE